MRRTPAVDGRGPPFARPLAFLLGALLLSGPAGWSAYQLWLRLPRQRVQRLQADELQAAVARGRRDAGPEVREAWALRQASNALTEALTKRIGPEQLRADVAEATRALSRSQVGRLYQAAVRMWLLEQGGEPLEKWWSAVRPFLQGLDGAHFAHRQEALTRHWARAYESVGVGPGTAYGLAEDVVGHPHGPFLQFFTTHLRRIIDERRQAGDAAGAAICRRVLHGLLKQWVLERGPAGLRLLAADLLSADLEAEASSETAADTKRLADELRSWRAAYRQAAQARPLAILDARPGPSVAPTAHERLLRRTVLMTWLASATATAGAVAVVLAWAGLPRRRLAARGGRLILHAVVVAVLLTVAGLVWIYGRPDAVRADLRADFSSLRYWWRHPFVAAGLTLGLLLIAAVLQRRVTDGKSPWLARVGLAAAATWLVLAAALWGSAIAGERARRGYERAARAAREDAIATTIGPRSEQALAALRRWRP
jgi:hypothetical protein